MKKVLFGGKNNFYKANLHCHSNLSDGKFSPEELKKSYKKKGYSILAITDHENLIIHSDLDDKDFPTTRYYEKFLDSCDSQDVALSEAKLGKIIELGDAQIEIIAPCSKSYENVNNDSVGLFLTHGENTFIFTGDAEALAEKEMADSGKLRHADVYKAGHHGSETSSCAEFMKAISPDYAVISCGEGNSYGHPNKKALKEISKYTDKIYRTDLNGTVTFVSDGKELKTNTEKD